MGKCFNCEKRSVGCHSSCDDYKEYRQELDEKIALKKDAKRKEDIVISTVMAGLRRRYKKYGPKKW